VTCRCRQPSLRTRLGGVDTSHKKPEKKKRRTREHVIADLSINHVERQALLAGFAVQRIVRDYGIDLFIATYDPSGEVENGEIRIQLKATDSPRLVREGQRVAVRVDQGDFRHWIMEPMPVVLAVYDATQDEAYWLYVQEHFESGRAGRLDRAGAKMTVHVPRTNIVTPAAMRCFAGFRDRILLQLGGLTHYD
jgi:Domain of unknown function (DUF4365)